MDPVVKVACDYLSFLYDGKYKEQGNFLFIYSDYSTFKVNLKDKERFNFYTLFHKNHYRDINKYHMQLKSMSIFTILFHAFAHDFGKNNDIFTYRSDVSRFKEDVFNIKNDLVIRENLLRKGVIVCPFCGRKLTIKNKDGDIRYTIHCRCKVDRHTVKLFYKSNKGYDWVKKVLYE